MTNEQRLWRLLYISALALFLELLLIRYLSVEIKFFLFFKNFVLMASFLGLGLGTGLSKGTNKSLLPLFHFTVSVLVVIALFSAELGLNSAFLPTGSNSFLWYHNSTIEHWLDQTLLFVVFFSLTSLIVFAFLPLGQLIGRALDDLPPSRSYAWDLGGSILGIVTYSLTAFLGWSPKVGIALVLFGALPLLAGFRARAYAGTLSLVVVALLSVYRTSPPLPSGVTIPAASLAPEYWWSPYHRVHWLPYPAQRLDQQEMFPGYMGFLNGHYYFDLLNFGLPHLRDIKLSRAIATASFDSSLYEALEHYSLPYRSSRSPREVLVLGAGPGNDAAAALLNGATDITAVEIDPAVIRLGKEIHPLKPYLDPKVLVVEDDARAFLARTKRQFDLVSFGHLDSINVISSFSSVRADSYVYTLESMRRAFGLVKPGGTLSISFAGSDWINSKIAGLLRKATEREPELFTDGYLSTVTFLVRKPGGDAGLPPSETSTSPWNFDAAVLKPSQAASIDEATLPTDDWPFLFLRDRTMSSSHLIGLATLILSAALLGRRVFLKDSVGATFPWSPFWLGVGFMLIETKSITELGLLFGSTWLVAAISIIGVLVMNLLAVAMVRRREIPSSLLFAALVLTIALNVVIPYEALLPLPVAARVLAATSLIYSPLFFAGSVFAKIFISSTNSSRIFGANLIGAMVGGALEYLSVVYGFKMLWYLAAVVYVLAFAAVPRSSKPTPAHR